MMLIHKQPPLQLQQQLTPAYTHRRHPSAPPAVIVQPTRTPGLLSLSKPQFQRQPKSPKPRQQQAQSRPALLYPAEITDQKSAVRPKKSPKSSDPIKSSPQRHGKPRHLQPQPPSQAEVSDSDPFIDSFSTKPKSNLTIKTAPKAIPVPAHRRPKFQQLSRSAPIASAKWDHICDDSNDELPYTPPTTPLRPRASMNMPFGREVPKRKAKSHKRVVSDFVFVMSTDDEATSSGPEDPRALLDFVRNSSRTSSTPQRKVARGRSLSPSSLEKMFELEAQKEVAGYFASSSFQNSPSPDDLPDPFFA